MRLIQVTASAHDSTGANMNKKLSTTVIFLLTIILVLAGCEPGKLFGPTLTPTPTATLTPTSTSIPIATNTAIADLHAALRNGPYLQSVTTDGIKVVWDTDLASTQWRVVYGETISYGKSITDTTVGIFHSVAISQLAPNTLYHYRLENAVGPQSDDFTFRTAASADETFHFVVFGDTQDNQHEVIDQVIAMEPNFVLHTGDLVTNGLDAMQWDQFLAMEHDLMARVPLYPTLGNHELEIFEYEGQGSQLIYFDIFHLPGNEHWYTFNYGNARFVCMDNVEFLYQPNTGSEQYLWLEETLATNTQPWLFVYFHIPPYYTSPPDPMNKTGIGKFLMPLFKEYGVDIVFNGHTHEYYLKDVDGVYYAVTGGGGNPFYLVTVNGKNLTLKGISKEEELDVINLSLP